MKVHLKTEQNRWNATIRKSSTENELTPSINFCGVEGVEMASGGENESDGRRGILGVIAPCFKEDIFSFGLASFFEGDVN